MKPHVNNLSIPVTLLLFAICAVEATASGEWYATTANGLAPRDAAAAAAPTAAITEETDDVLRFTLTTAGIQLTSLKTKQGDFVEAGWPEAGYLGEVGEPAIPVYRRMVVAPANAQVTCSVTGPGPGLIVDATLYGKALRLVPVRAPIPKIPGAAERASYTINEVVYAANEDGPAIRAQVSELGVVKGHRLVLVEVRPVAYNPAQQRLTVWPTLDVEIRFTGNQVGDMTRPLPQGLASLAMNPPQVAAPRDPTGNYLIIAPTDYAGAIASFAAEKNAQGYKATIWTSPAGATNTQIRTYIQSLWGDPQNEPDYILLVGDTDKIPHFTASTEDNPATDLYYTCMDGGDDWFPDIAIGRFPVRSTAQLADMVAKTLYIENGPLADPAYLGRAVFMSSEDNYSVTEGTHNYCIATYMDPNNFETDKLYSHTYDATTQQVRDAFNAGRIFGIYSGHGGEFEWADGPVFTQADVRGLSNLNMYPFVISFACLTGSYAEVECFCETWALTANKGAAAIWGSSVYSYWTEDDVLQRQVFAALYDDYIREIGPSLNQARARFATQMGTGIGTRRYFEMYNLFGDPSLAIAEAQAALRVSPAGILHAEGPEGGPFVPASMTYTLRNVAEYPINYEVSLEGAADWLTLSGMLSGTLPAGTTTDITVSVNANANVLTTGLHTEKVVVTNLTDHIGDSSRDVLLEVGRFVFTSTDVPKPIPDNSTVTSTLTINQPLCIGDINVSIDISHTYIGDLSVTLRSPAGVTVTLHDRSGGSAEDIRLTYDDEGTAPDGPGTMADFDRQSPVGLWTLTVRDLAGGDTGTLNSWTLRILPLGETCPPVATEMWVQTEPNRPIDIELQGITEGPRLLDFTIVALPAHGTLRDAMTNTPITMVPYMLPNLGNQVRYRPFNGYTGDDTFTFIVSDQTGVSDPAAVHVQVGGPRQAYLFDMNTNPGWTTSGQWAYGQPTGGGSHNLDPTAGFTGTHVYGYNLSGDYTNSMAATQYLTTGALDCSVLSNVELRFRRWLGVESATWDHANVQVSNNGTTWTTVWNHTGSEISDTNWSLQTFNIAAVADGQPAVFFRWGMGPTDSSVSYPGWNIDDVEIWGVMPPPLLLGDANCSGVFDLDDMDAFVLALTDPNAYAATYPACSIETVDLNLDTHVDGADVQDFVEVLLGL